MVDEPHLRAGAPWALSNQITTQKTSLRGREPSIRTSISNPFKTLDTQYNTQSEQILVNRGEASGLDQYTPLRYDAGGKRVLTQHESLDHSGKRSLSPKIS